MDLYWLIFNYMFYIVYSQCILKKNSVTLSDNHHENNLMVKSIRCNHILKLSWKTNLTVLKFLKPFQKQNIFLFNFVIIYTCSLHNKNTIKIFKKFLFWSNRSLNCGLKYPAVAIPVCFYFDLNSSGKLGNKNFKMLQY